MTTFRILPAFSIPVLFLLSSTCPIRVRADSPSYDLICNNGTRFICICYHGDGSLRPWYTDCYGLISGKNLTVVSMTAENLDATLLPRVERNFRKEIAQIVSKPCEELANNCKGTSLVIQPQSIIFLRILCGDRGQTTVYFAVLNSPHAVILKENNTLSAETAARSIGNKGQLERIQTALSPAKVTDVTYTTIVLVPEDDTTDPFRENFSLIIGLIIIAGVLVLIYIIAIAKVVRDVQLRKRKERDSKAAFATIPDTTRPNYGATNSPPAPVPPVPRPGDLTTRPSYQSFAENSEQQVYVRKSSLLSGSNSNGHLYQPVEEPQEPTESSPLISGSVSSPSKVYKPPRPAADLLFAPTLQIKKTTSSHSLTMIKEEMEEPKLVNPPRSATFHENLLQQESQNKNEAAEADSSEEDELSLLNPDYQELKPSLTSLQDTPSHEKPQNIPLQPEVTVESPIEPPATDQFEVSPATIPKEYRISQECLVTSFNREEDDEQESTADSDTNPLDPRNAAEKESSSSEPEEGEALSSGSNDTVPSGLGAPEYQRLAESNVSINRISDTEEEYLDLR